MRTLSLLTLGLLGASQLTACAADNLDGGALYSSHCAACHGETAGGGQGPPLAAPVSILTDDEIVSVIRNGAGGMPPIFISKNKAYAIVNWLHDDLNI